MGGGDGAGGDEGLGGDEGAGGADDRAGTDEVRPSASGDAAAVAFDADGEASFDAARGGLAFVVVRFALFFFLAGLDLGGGGGAFLGALPARGGGRSERDLLFAEAELGGTTLDSVEPSEPASGMLPSSVSVDGGCSSAIET